MLVLRRLSIAKDNVTDCNLAKLRAISRKTEQRALYTLQTVYRLLLLVPSISIVTERQFLSSTYRAVAKAEEGGNK